LNKATFQEILGANVMHAENASESLLVLVWILIGYKVSLSSAEVPNGAFVVKIRWAR